MLLDCRQYVIPGSARDLVPVSLVANLRESLCEENEEGDQVTETTTNSTKGKLCLGSLNNFIHRL